MIYFVQKKEEKRSMGTQWTYHSSEYSHSVFFWSTVSQLGYLLGHVVDKFSRRTLVGFPESSRCRVVVTPFLFNKILQNEDLNVHGWHWLCSFQGRWMSSYDSCFTDSFWILDHILSLLVPLIFPFLEFLKFESIVWDVVLNTDCHQSLKSTMNAPPHVFCRMNDIEKGCRMKAHGISFFRQSEELL